EPGRSVHAMADRRHGFRLLLRLLDRRHQPVGGDADAQHHADQPLPRPPRMEPDYRHGGRRQVADPIFDTARKYLSDRQLVELVELVGYYWMLGRIATVFQVELDVAQGAELYDAGLKVAGRSQQRP